MSDPIREAKVGNLGQLLLRAARLYNERSVEMLQQIVPELTVAHTSLFPHLDLDGTRSSVLAKRLGISKQAVGQLVNDLEKMGMLARTQDPADGRARLVVFTEKGRASIVEGLAVLKKVEREAAESVGEESIECLKSELERLLGFLEPDSEGACG